MGWDGVGWKDKREELGEKVERGIWPTQKFWRGVPYGSSLRQLTGWGEGGARSLVSGSR